MAEAFLYGNNEEPEFPYEHVAGELKWVPQYIQERTTKRGHDYSHSHLYSVLINALLVFSRARTSALFCNLHYAACSDFVRRLNVILEGLPRVLRPLSHRTELVKRNQDSYFITCTKSPRFIWKRSLMHREVGLNLDYAAAGHIGLAASSGRTAGMSICETSGTASVQVMGEMVHWEHINDTTSLKEFINRKVELFNTTMIKLQLPYRFDYYWNDDRNHYQAVVTTM